MNLLVTTQSVAGALSADADEFAFFLKELAFWGVDNFDTLDEMQDQLSETGKLVASSMSEYERKHVTAYMRRLADAIDGGAA